MLERLVIQDFSVIAFVSEAMSVNKIGLVRLH